MAKSAKLTSNASVNHSTHISNYHPYKTATFLSRTSLNFESVSLDFGQLLVWFNGDLQILISPLCGFTATVGPNQIGLLAQRNMV